MVTILIIAVEVRRLLEGGPYFNVDTQRCCHYKRAALETRHLLEEIRYIDNMNSDHYGHSL